MTDTELSAIRARCEAATPGPWHSLWDDDPLFMSSYFVATKENASPWDETTSTVVAVTLLQTKATICHESGKWEEDAAFIAHARTDIPALLAHIDELKDALNAAISQNAATIADHVIHMAQSIAGAIIGDKSVRKVCAKVICAHCHEVLGSFEEATAHGSVCKKHPAVIRAMKAEADKAALVEALEWHCERCREKCDHANQNGIRTECGCSRCPPCVVLPRVKGEA